MPPAADGLRCPAMDRTEPRRVAAWHRWVLVAIAVIAVLLLLVGNPLAAAR